MGGLTFFVPGPLPGLNDVISWAGKRISWLEKGNKRVYKLTVEKRVWDSRVERYALLAYQKAGGRGLPNPVEEAIKIHCIWFERDRRRDPDNIFGGGQKFIFDGLVQAGIIKNDTQRWIRGIEHELGPISRSKPGVLVTIE